MILPTRPTARAGRQMVAALLLLAPTAPGAETPTPLASVLDRPAVFTGPQRPGAGEVRIGLFAPDPEADPVARDLVRGIQLVVDLRNDAGGVHGRPVTVVRRWSDDPWRGGAREVTRMVYEDRVLALIGGPDADSTHVAEQVATKAWLPLLAPLASDPSLTLTRVPWIFRLAPDDRRQAWRIARLAAELGATRVGAATGVDRASRSFAAETVRALAAAGRPPVCHLELDNDFDAADAAARLASFGLDAVVIRLPSDRLAELLGALDASGSRTHRLLPWIPGVAGDTLGGRPSRTWILSPVTSSPTSPRRRWVEAAWRARWGESPGATGLLAADAAALTLEALDLHLAGGPPLVEALRTRSGFLGAATTYDWDPGGGNRSEPSIALRPAG